MKNIDNIKKSWRDVSINEWFNLRDKINDDALSNYEKEIVKVAFIANMTEEEVWNLKINELKKIQSYGSWINNFEINEKINFKKITINGIECKVNTDLHNFTVAQYIDFQTFFPKRNSKENYLGNILACFIIPVKKEYGEGYDIQDLVRNINESLDILTANEIIFFFLKQYLISMKVMENFFNWQIKILKFMKRKKDRQKIEEIENKWKEMKANILSGLPLLTTSAT